MNLQDKVAVITGGASGLGKAAAEALVARGAKVYLFDLNVEACKTVVEELGAENCAFASTNITDEDSVESSLDQAIEAFGRIHIVVNSAGIGPPAKVLDRNGNPLPLMRFKQTIDINLCGTFNVLSKAAARIARCPGANPVGSTPPRTRRARSGVAWTRPPCR